VVTADGDAVETRHLLGRKGEDVGDDPHALGRWVDVRVADHVLLENVVLNGPGELLQLYSLLERRHDVEGEYRQHRAVHGHAD